MSLFLIALSVLTGNLHNVTRTSGHEKGRRSAPLSGSNPAQKPEAVGSTTMLPPVPALRK